MFNINSKYSLAALSFLSKFYTQMPVHIYINICMYKYIYSNIHIFIAHFIDCDNLLLLGVHIDPQNDI